MQRQPPQQQVSNGDDEFLLNPRQQGGKVLHRVVPLEVVVDFLEAAFDGMGGVVDSIVDASDVDEALMGCDGGGCVASLGLGLIQQPQQQQQPQEGLRPASLCAGEGP